MITNNEGTGMQGLDMAQELQFLLEQGIEASEEDLGASYFTMRALGVAPFAAYQIVQRDMERLKGGFISPPPRIGKVNNKTSEPKSFYSPEEVDRLTEADLNNPLVLEDVMKSMTKWKK